MRPWNNLSVDEQRDAIVAMLLQNGLSTNAAQAADPVGWAGASGAQAGDAGLQAGYGMEQTGAFPGSPFGGFFEGAPTEAAPGNPSPAAPGSLMTSNASMETGNVMGLNDMGFAPGAPVSPGEPASPGLPAGWGALAGRGENATVAGNPSGWGPGHLGLMPGAPDTFAGRFGEDAPSAPPGWTMSGPPQSVTVHSPTATLLDDGTVIDVTQTPSPDVSQSPGSPGAPGAPAGDVTGGYSMGYGADIGSYGGDVAGGPGTGFGTGTGPGFGGFGDPGPSGLTGAGIDAGAAAAAAAGFSAGYDAGVSGGFGSGPGGTGDTGANSSEGGSSGDAGGGGGGGGGGGK